MNVKVAHLRNGQFEVDPSSDEIFKHIDTEELEHAPAISSDELELCFTRAASLIVGNQSRGRGLRIYMATRKSETEAFGAPSLITEGDRPAFGTERQQNVSSGLSGASVAVNSPSSCHRFPEKAKILRKLETSRQEEC